MDDKLFESIMNESQYAPIELENHGVQLKTEEELKKALDADVEVQAMHTGPFGENEGAVVIYFGKLNNCDKNFLSFDSDWLSEYGDKEELLEDNGEEDVIVLDKAIGQSNGNFYVQDAYTIEDRELFVSQEDYDKYCKGSNGAAKKRIGTYGSNPKPNGYLGPCPNCGGQVFTGHKVDGKWYDECIKCGTLYPQEGKYE